MKLRQDFTGGKVNQDLSDRLIVKGEYRRLVNGRSVGSYGDNVGVIEQARGNELVSVIPTIDNGFNVIGFCSHDDYLYYIATNLSSESPVATGDGTIIGRYNTITNAHQFVLRDLKTASNNLLISLDKDVLILSIEVFEGLLIFCDDKNNEPYKLNIEELISDPSLYESSNDILLIKAPPTEASIVSSVDDVVASNFLKGEPFQFALRYRYEDGEISAISPYSGTPVEVEDEQSSIDGRLGFMMNTLPTTVRVAASDDRFSSFDTNNISAGSNTEQAAAIDTNIDGSRIIAASRVHAVISGYSGFGSPSFVKVFNINNSPFSGGRWSGVAISGDGNTILISETTPGSNKDLIVYKASNPINSGTTMQEVYRIDSGDDQTNEIGRRICISSGGNIVYAGHSGTVSKSEAFGNQGTWNDVVNLGSIEREGDESREVFSMCCSSDGSVVYALCADTYNDSTPSVSVFRSNTSGANWSEVFFNQDLNRLPTNIDCSADGRIVAFVMGGDGNGIGDARIFISNNEGSSFSPRSSSTEPQYLTDVTVSTTGSFITVIGRGATGSTYAEVHQSTNFGETFTAITQTSIASDDNDYPVISSVNNETSRRSLNNIDNVANRIDISYNTGNKHVEEVDVLVRVVKTNQVFVIKTINKEAEGFSDNETRSLTFRNDGSYIAVPEKDTNKLYDNVPLNARCFEITQNALIFANYTDGRSLVNPNGTPIAANITATVISNALTTGTNLGLKTSSNNTYGIIYYDDFNRSSSILEGPDVTIPSSGSDTENPVKTISLQIGHLAPEWATKYKIARKPTLLEYDIIDGFDNAYVVNDEIYLELTSFTGVVPRDGDTLELFSEINTESSDDPYLISQGNLTVPILRYVDQLATGTQSVAVELSSGDTTTRVDSQSDDTASPVPRGRYIVINSQDLDNYSNTDVTNETSRFLSSLFYIIRNGNIEDQKLFQEVPGVFSIDENRRHRGTTDQTDSNPATVVLNNDFDIVWGQFPPREMFKYDITTNISNLGRPNLVSENFREVDRFASMIASEPFVDDTNLNGLSSFNLSLIPFKDLDKRDGPIQLIRSEDTNVEVYQEDKISRTLYRKNMLTTADGSQSVTQAQDIWGEQIRSIDEYGMSHPESFAEWGGRRYYADAKRGVVIRKSADGQTEISSYGLLDFFHRELTENQGRRIMGYYEPKYNNYCIVVLSDTDENSYHGVFAERNKGWELEFNWLPEKVTNNGVDAYSYKNGRFYKHDANSRRGNFYGQDEETSVNFFFNDANDMVKTISALSINGSLPSQVTITTEDQTGSLNSASFEEVEGLLFSDAPKDQNDAGRDINFAGIVGEDNTGTEIPLSVIDSTYVHVGDVILKNGDPLLTLGNCTAVNSDSITIDNSVTVSEGDLIMAKESTPINGDILKGRVIGIEVKYSASDSINLLNSVELEVDESKQ